MNIISLLFIIQYANLSGKYLVKAPRCLIRGGRSRGRENHIMRQNQYIYIPDLSDFENRQTNEMVGYFVLQCSGEIKKMRSIKKYVP